MQIYVVGGWVRDQKLQELGFNVQAQDKDWVVVGSTPEEMLSRGYLSVGKDFPVFLHPVTHEEYALARTERKNGHGYHGFFFKASPEVTLEEDLKRRDLTINAMALDSRGNLIDPYGGMRDLRLRTLRHVSGAFAEDPVRLLRVARFSARFPDFVIADETKRLLAEIVHQGEADTLTYERVFKELGRALTEPKPSLFFKTLLESGYLQRVFPSWHLSTEILEKLDEVDSEQVSLIRFGMSFANCSEQETKQILLCLRAPAKYADLAVLISGYGRMFSKQTMNAEKVLELLTKTDAIRRPERFLLLLKIVSYLDKSVLSQFWEKILKAIQGIDTKAIAKAQTSAKDIPQAIFRSRCNVIQEILQSDKFTNSEYDKGN